VLSLDSTATLDWTDEVILGRHGEPPGELDLHLDVTIDGAPLLRHQLRIGPDHAGWDGPAVLGANRCIGLRLTTGRPPHDRGWMQLEGPGYLKVAVASDQIELRRSLYESS
jgi:urease accessory protein